MAKIEVLEETGTAAVSSAVDVVVGITGTVDLERLRAVWASALRSFQTQLSDATLAVAHIDAGQSQDLAGDAGEFSSVKLLAYSPAPASGGAHWLTSGATYNSLFSLAGSVSARACVVVSSDLATLERGGVSSLAAPVLRGTYDLAMPIYAQSRFEGLLNASILSPMTRALYGKRVRYPLAQDFGVAAALLPVFEQPAKRMQAGSESLFWPATEAAIRDQKICQVCVDVHHETVATGVDLTTVLSQVVGPLFADMETNASAWQRVRGSFPIPTEGAPYPATTENRPIDTRPMVESFQLASRNLQDVWSLVLPPVTQLELKRLSKAPAEQFHLPDALWVRILYDFGLAYRLRTLSRTHLMGALTPLYLAWVASYAGEVSASSDAEADARLDKLAQAYEAGKSYLVSRWRWPDRFNP